MGFHLIKMISINRVGQVKRSTEIVCLRKLLIIERKKDTQIGVLVYCAFNHNTQKTEVGIFASELNASQVNAIRSRRVGSTH